MTKTQFPYEVEIEVAFRDIDALGHVNNAVFFSYMEFARVKYIAQLFAGTELQADSPLDIPIILVEATCTYYSPALLGERLVVGIGLSRFGNKSFDLLYRMMGEDGRLIASGKTIQVMYNYLTRSAFPIPADVREKVYMLQGDWNPPETAVRS